MLFAEREYEVEGKETKLVLQINEPRRVGRDWICEHRLVGVDPDYEEFFAARGVAGSDFGFRNNRRAFRAFAV